MLITPETPTKDLTIAGQIFKVPEPYNEGHTMTKSEAGALNQTLGENIRNNNTANIKKAVKAASAAGNPFDLKAAQADLDGYIEDYDFGVRRGRSPADPVEREALSIAKDLVKTALRKNGFKISDFSPDALNAKAEQAILDHPKIMKEAKRRVEGRLEIALTDDDKAQD